MKVLIIEDEALAAEKLQVMLKEIDPGLEIAGITKSVEGTLHWLQSHPEPDLIISDIHLSDSLCFDIFTGIKPRCPVIFATAYDQYAIQAFEVNSIDYLLKPIQKEKLKNSIEKFHRLKSKNDMAFHDLDKIAAIITQSRKAYKSRFLVKVGTKIKSLQVNQICYFFTHEKMTYIVTKDGKKYPVDHSLEEIDNLLNPNDFFRVNRKYVIHIDAVNEIHPYFKGRLKISLTPPVHDAIVISAEKTPSFKAWLDK